MVQSTTIKSKSLLFKKGEETKLELIYFNDFDFTVVSIKDRVQTGEQVLFVFPDYCLPETLLFEDYIRPQGDPKKSRLGANRRLRAVKFNLHLQDKEGPVYSNGIFFTKDELNPYTFNVTSEQLGLTKYEEKDEEKNEEKGVGIKLRGGLPFPEGMYKTNEDNILIKNNMSFPQEYTGTVKVDGSSITLWYKNGQYGICSRNLLKPFTKRVLDYKREPTFWERIKILFGYHIDLYVFKEIENDDTFVKIGKPYLDILVKYCKEKGINFVLRGELCGTISKGSGNKNNPHSKLSPQILFFGLDEYTPFGTIKQNYDTFLYILTELSSLSNLQFNSTGLRFKEEFNSKDELIKYCEELFKQEFIEGIVVQNKFEQHAKVMNLAYDEKK